MNEYPDWIEGVTPRTDDKAKVTKCRHVRGVKALMVAGGRYREAKLDGVFEIVDGYEANLDGRILIRCAWFGVTPPQTYPQLSVDDAQVIMLPDYTGCVADDIGR